MAAAGGHNLLMSGPPGSGNLTTGIIMQSVLALFGFWLASVVMNWGVAFFGYLGLIDPATLPFLIIALSIFGLVTMPLGNLWSGWREVKADKYALKMTGNPQAFISAMTCLANQNLAEANPPAWVEFLLHSHPSIRKRVAMAQSFQVEELVTLSCDGRLRSERKSVVNFTLNPI